jgi:hypothetical protein
VLIGDLMGAGGTRELMAVGETASARLQTLAAPDTIVVSDATNADQPAVRDGGPRPVDLKGFNTVHRVWRVRRETSLSGRSRPSPARRHPSWAGTKSWNSLLRQWRQTIAGDGRVVLCPARLDRQVTPLAALESGWLESDITTCGISARRIIRMMLCIRSRPMGA